MSAPPELAREFPSQTDRIHALRDSDARFRALTNRYHDTNRAVYRAQVRIEPVSQAEETLLRQERAQLKDQIGRALA